MSGHAVLHRVFRLVDLMAILGVFAILAAMTVPALVTLREASRRSDCKNNLKDIAIAAHGYHTAYERFPPGWLGPNPDAADPSTSPNVGALVFLLPYLENEPLYQQLWFQTSLRARTDRPDDPRTGEVYNPPSNVPWWKLTRPDGGASNLELARTRIKRFICPSDDPYASEKGTIVAVHIYGRNAPKDFLRPTIFNYAEHPEARDLGRTNYLGVAGCAGNGGERGITGGKTWGTFEGVFTNRSDVTLGRITVMDGTSNTLMFGESSGGADASERTGRRAYAFSWFTGALPTYYGMPRDPVIPWHSFGSKHSAKVHFAFADGRVVGLYRRRTAETYSEDWWVLQELAGWRDASFR